MGATPLADDRPMGVERALAKAELALLVAKIVGG